jgi:pyridoxamine 5'-phosphate oxidase
MDLSQIRTEYQKKELSKDSVDGSPLVQLEHWLNEAREANCSEYSAMSLATASPEGQPSIRTVLLKYVKPEGLYFFTNYESRKGQEIAENPKVAALFFWPELERQVKVEGFVHKAPAEISDQYFKSRPVESQISAIISRQSSELPDREALEEYWNEETEKWKKKEIKRPEYWGGYLIKPTRVEFWQGRPYRLHDRILYKKSVDGWNIVRLSP